jgi:hypothetical protein
LLAGHAAAEKKYEQRHGDYTVYYSVFPSSFLQADIAANLGITRSRDRAVLNVSLRHGKGDASSEQSALVQGTSSDLIHSRPLVFKEVREQGAIYYLAEIRVSSQATLYFDLQVSPNPDDPPLKVSFNQEVFPE